MLNQDLMEDVRDYIHDLIVEGKIGSDGTTASTSDTSLYSEISGSSETLTKTKFFNGITFNYSHELTSQNSIREFSMFDSSGNMKMRGTMPELYLDSGDEINISTQILILQETK